MKYLNTLPNSFIVGEKDNDGNILEQYGFPKGGLTYLIKGNNIKFYLTEDYFYKNVVFSADAPFLINGIPVSVDNLPAALKNIFKVEQEQVDVDTEFNTESFNPIANAPVAIRFNDVDSTIDSLSGEVQTKADIEDIPTNVSELVNDAGYITEESLSEDYATKVWVQEQGYVTDISGKQDVSGMTAYTTNDAFSTHTGNTDIHVTASDKQNWNNKSDFSGSYNDLTDKPTIPVVPTNVSAFNNDAGYVTQANIDAAVSGKADTSAVTASLAALDEKKLDASAYTPTDLSNYYTKDETSGATEIATALDDKADIEDIPTNVSELVNDAGYVTQNDIDAAVSGKVNTTDFNTYSAATDNRLSEDEEVTAAALNALNAVSGDVNTLSGQVATISGDVSTLSGKVNTDETILTGHTANTDIHVTASDKQNWNNKSDFSGDYNDLTNKPTIPVVPTNVSAFNNDAGYATSGYVDSSVSGKVNTTDFNTYSASTDARLAEDEEVTSAALNELNDALDGKADLEDIPTNVSELVNDAGYATSGYVDSSVSGKVNTTDFNTYSASTDNRLSEDEEVTAAALNVLNSNKQDKLTAGENITINGNVISAAGGNNVIELTQAQYDALTDIDPDAFYIITDATGAVTTGQVQTMINDSISGKADTSAVTEAVSSKMDTSAFNIYSANTNARLSEDEEVTAAALTALDEKKLDISAYTPTDLSNYYTKSETSGATQISTALASKADKSEIPSLDGYATETWVQNQGYLTEHQDISGKLDVSAFNTYSGSVNTQLNSKASESDLNALNNTVTAHTADTVIHVTASDKQNWNNKSNFSGDYNDLTNKPTIPTVPTSNTAFTNDAGYITSSALDGYATTGDVQTATSDMATKTWVGNQGYLTEHQSLSNYYTKSETSGATEISTALASKADTSAFTAHTADTTIHTTSAEKASWNGAATNASNAITALGGLKLVQLTQAQYDTLATKDASALYIIVN